MTEIEVPAWKQYGSLFLRGFVIVALTATNTGQIAGKHWLGAFLVGFGISFVWFSNARSAAHSELRWAREAYALGAATGTSTGMLIVRLLYG